MSSSSRRMTTVGQIVNLLSVDAQKIQDFFLYMNLVWSVPFQIGLCIVFMWGQVRTLCKYVNDKFEKRIAIDLSYPPTKFKLGWLVIPLECHANMLALVIWHQRVQGTQLLVNRALIHNRGFVAHNSRVDLQWALAAFVRLRRPTT